MMHNQYDIFLSHLAQDNVEIVRELINALKGNGLSVLDSGLDLEVNQNLAQQINKNLTQSDLGVLIISPAFFEKKWSLMELATLFANTPRKILPILYQVDTEKALTQLPNLDHQLSLSSTEHLPQIVEQVVKLLHQGNNDALPPPEGTSSKSIQKLIGQNKFQKVFDELSKIVQEPDEHYKTLIILSGEFHELKRKEQMGVASPDLEIVEEVFSGHE